MVDQVFSCAEPGFQEVRTSDYLAGILERNGFTVTRGVAGIPTAFTATWGSGGPLIALGSDIDGLLGVSQTPGSPAIKPLVAGAPGHGEGHNSGMRSEEHTSELPSLMRITYAVFCLKQQIKS